MTVVMSKLFSTHIVLTSGDNNSICITALYCSVDHIRIRSHINSRLPSTYLPTYVANLTYLISNPACLIETTDWVAGSSEIDK